MDEQKTLVRIEGLALEEINTILTGLNELPHKVVADLFQKIKFQVGVQLQPPPAAATETSDQQNSPKKIKKEQ